MMPMKLYEVELKRTYVVEALDENHAEDEARKLLKKDGNDKGYADWEVNNTWEYEA